MEIQKERKEDNGRGGRGFEEDKNEEMEEIAYKDEAGKDEGEEQEMQEQEMEEGRKHKKRWKKMKIKCRRGKEKQRRKN